MELCARMVERIRSVTTYPVHWFIADGGQTPITPPPNCSYYRTTPHLHMVDNFKENLLALLDMSSSPKYEYLYFIEDDDWYAPEYVMTYLQAIDTKKVALYGEGKARYYNVANNSYKVHENTAHASLAQTAFTPAAREQVRTCVAEATNCFIDLGIWKKKGIRSYVHPRSTVHVGMKALPGRLGVGYGHRRLFKDVDPDWKILRSWIGDDVAWYQELSRTSPGIGGLIHRPGGSES